ncbi:MAG: glycosyltransferase family 2 protein [Thermoplasmatales archaeon]
MTNKISIIITAYNRKEFLLDAVRSVLQNDYPRELYEIVVCKNFKDPFIDSFLSHNDVFVIDSGNVNIGEQLFLAISNSSCDIICFLDDDDRFKVNKLKSIFFKFSEDKEIVYYHNQTDSIDEKSNPLPGNIHKRISNKVILRGPSVEPIAEYLRTRDDFTLYSLMFNLSCVSVRRSVISPYIQYLRKIIDGTDWFVFYCALLSSGKLYFDTEILTDYRVHRSGSNIFTTNASLLEIAKFSISKFNTDGHFLSILLEMCHGTDVETILRAKMLEEKILMRIQGQKSHVTIREYSDYLKLLRYVVHPSVKTKLIRFIFILSSLLFPSITGIFYNLYRKHNLKSNLYSYDGATKDSA